MATAAENLQSIKTNLLATLASETAYELANGARPQYSLDGESYDWPGYQMAVLEKVEKLNQLIQVEDGAFEVRSFGRI